MYGDESKNEGNEELKEQCDENYENGRDGVVREQDELIKCLSPYDKVPLNEVASQR